MAAGGAGFLRLEGVTKRYGAVTAVQGLSLTVAQGEFLGVLGPSGCGKTTTLQMIAGFEAPTPDDFPVIGRSGVQDGVVHAFGFCGHGFELAPLVGDIVAQLVLQGRTNRPIAPFAPDRFGAGPVQPGRDALHQPAG